MDIIVCVHNSPEDVRSCIASVLPTLAGNDRMILVDDGSAEETKAICEESAHAGNVSLIRRSEGSGFCRAANAGIVESDAEYIVLLNSDTIVPTGWIDRIRSCMEANWQIGIVGPLSNAGGWQSIPHLGPSSPPNNKIRHDHEVILEIQEYCAAFRSRFDYPIVEQLNGFCMAISRNVIETVGRLDEQNFPMGYGEEVDFTLRAQDEGFLCAIAIDCFVYHAKTKSYTPEMRKQYAAAGRKYIDGVHGAKRVAAAVENSRENPILRAIREDAAQVFRQKSWLLDEE